MTEIQHRHREIDYLYNSKQFIMMLMKMDIAKLFVEKKIPFFVYYSVLRLLNNVIHSEIRLRVDILFALKVDIKFCTTIPIDLKVRNNSIILQFLAPAAY